MMVKQLFLLRHILTKIKKYLSFCSHIVQISMKKKERKKNISGRTTLHLAALSNCKEIAEVLLSHCANINEKDNYGQTALHEAAYSSYKETA
ncbi:ankyrin repeat protein, putative [Trichomonas vaginalis G3]|uniref:Ankyrin repeat protein, putative n=1 Tax=Trichomonas vaginalis (strain ATCC PRA-98 / G3) TaxID=412133 RepID=A2F4A5_TRIV3|nr:Ankyrin repeat family [Trichomonas vaginalis G3]EAY00284.1 ankyrin repeat protein, putative [Trichomonas vaginalis G3]KAI5492714.1 Ankyrin repeat family [Trichomonas vaginalis G3]|eukprot:XP_001313213.1 ankyrin repeat protein [Trichomonas vaginalis G3]